MLWFMYVPGERNFKPRKHHMTAAALHTCRWRLGNAAARTLPTLATTPPLHTPLTLISLSNHARHNRPELVCPQPKCKHVNMVPPSQ